MRRATLFGLVVGVPVSLLFLWLAFRNADVDAVWDAAREADLGQLLLAVPAIALVYVFQAARWRRIAGSARPALGGFFEMVVGAVACNNVLPGRLGEWFRARWLGVAAPMSYGRALGTVGLDRGSDLLTLFLFLVVSLPFVASATWVGEIVAGAAVLVALLILALAAARIYARVKHRERRERGRLRRIVRDTIDLLAEPLGRRRVAVVLALSVLAWAAFALAVWLVARSLGVELGVVDCLFVTAVLNLGVAIPSSPGFVGTYQWLAVAALGVFDIAREDALAFSFLLQATWYVPTTLVGGALVLFRLDWGIRGRPRGVV
jgi:glycosyltransferase 2 family protein